MKAKNSLPAHLTELLEGGHAHITFDAAVKNWAARLCGIRPKGAAHSAWEILEHLRLAQWDILEFTRNPKHVSPEWPSGYWPKSPAPPSAKAWDNSIQSFRADLRSMIKLVQNKKTDLFAPLPHGSGQTVLREALLLADHNAYHLGELLLLRRLLGAWK
jgi:DinB superfamily